MHPHDDEPADRWEHLGANVDRVRDDVHRMIVDMRQVQFRRTLAAIVGDDEWARVVLLKRGCRR